ncbi:TPA: H-NS family nucleoid-associated regulatory protein [Burkholderia cenocepacia]|uniref:H-NS histone family protein n=1 Tax=Burkholderia cenocepacia TaxID=95486 RepID=UPI0009B1BDA0|nr:H-NS histone family protein [Burkholderia cenocepacia]MCW3693231.1 H-NS histone family protein [Burkholderia cenocepacia]QUN38885.1 H-NS histone family protein [Burkholderia cenocepacia]QUO29211.1 H-NS histone family protein [Burkholderia cenocepacia]
MSDYRTLLEQFDQFRIEVSREIRDEKERLATLVATRVREVLEEFGLEIDVVPRDRYSAAARKKRVIAPKYWNPKTGQTWSGRGRAPKWIVGKDREQFRIEHVGEEGEFRGEVAVHDDNSGSRDGYLDGRSA